MSKDEINEAVEGSMDQSKINEDPNKKRRDDKSNTNDF